MKYFILAAILFLAGCRPSFEEVRYREAACSSLGGEVKRQMDGKVITSIWCEVDGAIYWVAPSGKLI